MTAAAETALPSAADLGVEWAIYAPQLDHFPWQLALPGGRVALVSADLSRSAVVPGGEREPDDPHGVPLHLVPPAVLAAAGDALKRADADELGVLLRRRRQIAQLWGVDDVVAVRPDLTDDQAWDVLREVDTTQDAEVGITWQTLERAAEKLFGPDPDGSGA